MEITKKDLQNQTKQIQCYNKILSEDFEKLVKIIGEDWGITDEKVDKLSGQLDIEIKGGINERTKSS